MTTTNGNTNGTVGVAFPSGNRIDLLLDQMGRLTELVAATNLNITSGFAQTSANIEKLGEKIDTGFAETRAAIEQSSAEQNNKIDRLMTAQSQPSIASWE